jgi:hypothetical protein
VIEENIYRDLNKFADFSKDYSLPKDFRKFVRAFLAPIYFDSAASLDRKYSIPFTKAWAWESQRIMTELGVEEEYGEAMRFAHRRNDWSIPGASFQLSEIYRSAFVRTLAWFHQQRKLSELDYATHSTRTCPVDLSLWEIKSRDLPEWWPKPFISSKPESETLSMLHLESLKELISLKPEGFGVHPGVLLAAEGPLISEGQTNVSGRFALIAFAYRVHGRNLPEPEEVAHSVLWQSSWYANPESPFAIKIVQGTQSTDTVCADDHWVLEDLEIVPLLSRFHSASINLWQWFRGARPLFGLSSFLQQSDVSLRLGEDAVHYEHHGEMVTKAYDWRLGTLEHDSDFDYISHGQVVEANADWLQAVLSENRLRLGFALQAEIRVREHTYSTPKEYVSTELVNLEKVIVSAID